MKLITIILYVLNILNILQFTISLRSRTLNKLNLQDSNKKEISVEDIMNVGWNVFEQNEDYLKEPIKLLTKNNIFENKVNFKIKSYDRLDYNTAPYESFIKKNLTYVNPREYKLLNSHSVLGTYVISNNSPTKTYDGSVLISKKAKSISIEDNNYILLELSQNHLNQFPSLNKEFFEEAYRIFYEKPQKESFTEKFNFRNLQENQAILLPMIDFFKKYGTHYVNKGYFGFKSGFRNSIDNNNSGDLNKEKNMKDYILGHCKVTDKKIIKSTCDINNPYLIKFEVEPISDLFSPMFQTNSEVNKYQGKILDDKIVRKLHDTMETALEMLEDAIKIDKMAVISFEFNKLNKDSPKAPCYNEDNRKKYVVDVMRNFTNFKRKLHYMNLAVNANKETPVVTVKNYGFIQNNLALATSKDQGLFACQKKNYLLPINGKFGQFSTNYILDIKIVAENDKTTFVDAGYTCDKKWEYKDPKGESEIGFYACKKTTQNPFNPNIITDVKVFEFDPSTYRCSDKYLKTYIDNYQYDCNCDIDLSLLSDKPNQGDTFICIARAKQHLSNITEEINQPDVKFRRVKWILPKEEEEVKTKLTGVVTNFLDDDKNIS